MRRRLLIFLLCCAAISCERTSKDALTPIAKPKQLQIEPIAQLSPNLLTHVVVDWQKNLYWCQETAGGQDVVFVTTSAGLPHATDLTTRRIFSLLGTNASGKASGNIQSLALGADGKIYFYFLGTTGRVVQAAFGSFDPLSGVIRILADTDALMMVTQMKHAIALARGRLIVTGRLIRLFIRHTDNWVLLDYDPRKLALDEQMSGEHPPLLYRTITMIGKKESAREMSPLELTSDQLDLFAGPEAASESDSAARMLVVDRHAGIVYRVTESGEATLLASLVLIPQQLSEPLIDATEKPKRIIFWAAESDRIEPRIVDHPDHANIKTSYPALLSISTADGSYEAIGRENAHAPGEFAVYAVQMQQLVPMAEETYVGFDNASGQLLRIRITR